MPLDPPAAELERFALAATVAEAPSAAASLLNKGSELSDELARTSLRQRSESKEDFDQLKASFKESLTLNSKLLHKAMTPKIKECGSSSSSSADSAEAPTRKNTPIVDSESLENLLNANFADSVPRTPTSKAVLDNDKSFSSGGIRSNHR